MRKDTEYLFEYLSVFNPNVTNADQNNSEYEHFLRSEKCHFFKKNY